MPDAPESGRSTLRLDNKTARITLDLEGGSIIAFQLGSHGLNPLAWDSWSMSPTPDRPPPPGPRPMGHFLCLDRWGPATEAETAHGMGAHGEASTVRWEVTGKPSGAGGPITATLAARLPLAGLTVERKIAMDAAQACFSVCETVTNTRPLGRIYNCVQHPTICPPFLDTDTMVDSNGTRGFMQATPMPTPEDPESHWPEGLLPAGTRVDLRFLRGDPAPWVATFRIEETYGWVTAATPSRNLLFGYLWPTVDYPWFNLWSRQVEGKPVARGLEFGTSGLHRPGPDLVAKGKIFGSPLFRFIDADQSQTLAYAGFLMPIPPDFKGTARVDHRDGRLTVHERGDSQRTWTMETGSLFDRRNDLG